MTIYVFVLVVEFVFRLGFVLVGFGDASIGGRDGGLFLS